MLGILRRKINVVKVLVYTALSIGLGVASIVQQTSTDRIYVSSIFQMTFVTNFTTVRRSTSGFMTRVNSENCVAKIIMPFDNPPSLIEDRYFCRWDEDSVGIDSLCYTDFGCKNVDTILFLSLLAPCLFLFGYVLLSGIIMIQRITGRFLIPRYFWAISGVGFVSILAGFAIAKTIPFITSFLFEEVFDHIRRVTIRKGGFEDLNYDIIKYVFEPRVVLSRTMIDIMAGFTAAFFFLIIEEHYRRIRKLKKRYHPGL